MRRLILAVLASALLFSALAWGQPPQPANELAAAMAERLSKEMKIKAVVGEPIKAGSVTLIPILMVDVNFAGANAGMPVPKGPAIGADLSIMSGEARPLGFVAITKKGTRFISVGRAPAK